MDCWGTITKVYSLEIVAETDRTTGDPADGYDSCTVTKVPVTYLIDGATGTSFLYKVLQYGNAVVDNGCLPTVTIAAPSISDSLSVTGSATGFFTYGGRFSGVNGSATNTTSPAFPDLESRWPVPFCAQRKDEEGNPFSAWDGSTTFGESGRPSKYSYKAVTVYGPGSDYCIKLLPEQLSRLYYRVKNMTVDISAKISTGATSAAGSLLQCIAGQEVTSTTNGSLGKISAEVPTVYVRRGEISTGNPIVYVVRTPRNPELSLFNTCAPSINGASHYFKKTAPMVCLGPVLCASVSTAAESPQNGYNQGGDGGYTGYAYVSASVSASSDGDVIPSAENVLITSDGDFWFKPGKITLSADNSGYAYKGEFHCTTSTTTTSTGTTGTGGTTTDTNDTTDGTESTESTSSTASTESTESTSTEQTTTFPPTTNEIQPLNVCDFVPDWCNSEGKWAQAGYTGDPPPSGFFDPNTGFYLGPPDGYEPPGYAAANGAWISAQEAINQAILEGASAEDIQAASDQANWDAYYAAQDAANQFNEDNGIIPDPPPNDTEGG